MSKFDLMANDEHIEIEISGSVKLLQSVLDKEIAAGLSRQEVRLKIGLENFSIYDVAQVSINEKESVSIIWVERGGSGYYADTLRHLLEIKSSTDKIAVVVREPIRLKFGYESTDKFKLVGCRVTDISATGHGVVITASPMGKFKGIKTFIKDLEFLGN